VAAGGTVIKWTSDTLSPGLKTAPLLLHKKLEAFMDFQSEQVQDYMRSNAPWTDRTGNARNGLFARGVSDVTTHSIVCYHTVPYGIWLEVRFSGKNAIILPTILNEGKRVMSSLRHFLDRLT
jgi:hypothetical protein